MAKTLRKTLMYGLLLAAGMTLGMQLAESGTTSVYGPGFQTGSTAVTGEASTNPAYTGGMATAWPIGQGSAAVPGVPNGYSPGTMAPQANLPADESVSGGTGQPFGGQAMQTPADVLLPPPSPPAVDRFADKAAQLLQQASQKSIHWVASLFGPGE